MLSDVPFLPALPSSYLRARQLICAGATAEATAHEELYSDFGSLYRGRHSYRLRHRLVWPHAKRVIMRAIRLVSVSFVMNAWRISAMSKLAWTVVLATLLAAPAAAQFLGNTPLWRDLSRQPTEPGGYKEVVRKWGSPAQQRLLAAVQGGRTPDRPTLQKRQKVLAKARHPHITQTGNRAY